MFSATIVKGEQVSGFRQENALVIKLTVRQANKKRGIRLFLVVCGVLVIFAFPMAGQTGKSESCIAQGELIYTPGEDYVKPPKLQIERAQIDRPSKLNSPVVLEVLLNPIGKICEVRALKAPDRDSAKQFAENVVDNFRFTPATRKGSPVAVRFKVVFNAQGGVETQ
jgi:hypothetical protein